MRSYISIGLSLAVASLLLAQAWAENRDFNFYWRRQQQRAKREVEDADIPLPLEERAANYRYYNAKTKPYFIEKWPLVNFDTGEFYSGQVPIDEFDPSRKLFFIFKPAINTTSNDLTIWLNGGPGCSSLVGFFQVRCSVQAVYKISWLDAISVSDTNSVNADLLLGKWSNPLASRYI